MKHCYGFICLLLLSFFNVSFLFAALDGTISGTTTVCQNGVSPNVVFTGSGATAPYTFTYQINGGATTTIVTSAGSSSVNLAAPVGVAGSFSYVLKTVKSGSTTKTLTAATPVVITVDPAPSGVLNSNVDLGTVNGLPGFRFCSNEAIQFFDGSVGGNSLYEINWGDGTPNFSSPTLTSVLHPYASGLWTLTYTVTGVNGCKKTTSYQIYVGTSPNALLSSNASTSGICAGNSLTFDISGTESNPTSTNYTITFNDGTPSLSYTSATLPAQISHTFTKSSCGYTAITSNGSYQNSFSATIISQNECDSKANSVAPIYVSTAPVANYTVPSLKTCSGVPICFTNTSSGNQVVGPNPATCSQPKLIWTVTPSTGVTYSAGSIAGNDFSNTTPSTWTTGSNVFCPIFANPGVYTVSLKVGNKCGIDQKDTVITVENALIPQFTMDTNEGCTPLVVATTNTTDITNSTTPTYLWTVTYAAGNCGSGTPTWNYVGGSTSSSVSPSFNFVTPGTYTLKLSTINSCGTVTTQKTVVVKKPPTVSINNISNSCGSASIHPVAVIAGCAPVSSTLTYNWSFPGGTPASATTLDPGVISYNTLGNYSVSLIVTNECGSTAATSNTFTVNEIPTVTAVANQVKCKGDLTSAVVFTGTGGPVYEWTNDNPSIGLAASGVGNIAAFTAINSGNTVQVATIVVTPKISATGCYGSSKTFTISVNPQGVVNQPTSQILTNGDSFAPITFTTTNIGGTTTYTWSNDTPDIGLAASGSGAINSFSVVNISTTPKIATITVTPHYENGGVSCSGESKDFQIEVNPSAQVNQPANVSICNKRTTSQVNFATVNSGGTTTYAWTNDKPGIGLPASGNGSIPNFQAMNIGSTPIVATITVTPTYTNGGVSNVGVAKQFTITVEPAAEFVSHPVSSTVCLDGAPSVMSVAVQYGEGVPTYQWYSNTTNLNSGGTLIPFATNSDFTPPTNTIGTTYYYCVVTMTIGLCSTLVSNTAEVTVTALATITSQPQATQSLCVGGSLSAPLSIAHSGGLGSASYKWYQNGTNSNVGGTLIVGENNATYMPSAYSAAGTYYYYSELIMSGSGCGSVFSNPAEVIVVSDPVINLPAVATQTLCKNAVTTNLAIGVTGGVGSYSYQWYENDLNNNTTGTVIVGAESAVYTPSTSAVGTKYYYCQVTQSGVDCQVTSLPSEVVVNEIPVFVAQPSSSTICMGESATELVVNYDNGAGVPVFKWYSNTVNSTVGGTEIPAANTNTYTPPTSTAGTMFYYCEVALPSGGCTTIYSSTATVVVKQNPVIATKNISVCSGNSFSVLPVTAFGDIVPMGTTYTWSVPVILPLNSITGASQELIPQIDISQTLTNTTNLLGTATYTVTPKVGDCLGVPFTVVVTVVPTIVPTATVVNSTCFGANNGSISLGIVGGSPFLVGDTYHITWTGPSGFTSNAQNISSLSPGDYSVTIMDAANCPVAKNYTITEPSEMLLVKDLQTDVKCFGGTNGALSITVSGGTLPYNYVWTKNGTFYSNTEDLVALGAGVYQVTVADANSCTPKVASYTIVEPTQLQVTLLNAVNVLCNGSSTGAITVDVQGGVKSEISVGVFDYHYSWIGPNGFVSTTQNISNLLAGIYQLTVTDENGCSNNLTITITQPSPLVLTTTVVPITTAGNDGSITLDITGGVLPYTVEWSNLVSGLVQTNLSPGDYTAKVTDGNNCQKQTTVTLINSNFAIFPVVKNISCHGATDGSISLNINGGVPPLKVVWADNPSAGSVRNGLAGGIYSMTLTDAASNKITKSFVIVEPQPITISANVVNAFDCANPNSGSVDIVPIGGTQPYSFMWSNGATTEDLVNVPAGNYFVTVTDAKACEKIAHYEILRQDPIVVSISSVDDFSCVTKKDSKIYTAQVAGGTAPYQFTWSSGAVSGANNQTMQTSQNGIVTLLVKDASGCSTSTSINVVIPVIAVPEILITTQPTPLQSVCVGGATAVPFGIAYSGGSGDASYKWFVNSVNSNVGGTEISGANSATYQPPVFTAQGTYYYYAECSLSGNRCCPVLSNVARVNVVSDPEIVSQPQVSQHVCQGALPSELTVSASGGIGDYIYKWYVNSSNNNNTGSIISGATSAVFSPPTSSVGTKYYYCVVSQTGLGCSVVSATAEVIVNPQPSFTAQPLSNTYCWKELPTQMAVAYKDGVGVPTYQWYSSSINSVYSGSMILGATNPIYLPATTEVGVKYYYCVVSFSAGNCTLMVSDIAAVTVLPSPEINAQSVNICSDSVFNITPTESVGNVVPVGTTYTWTNPVISPVGAITGASAQVLPQSSISQTLKNISSVFATVTYSVTPTTGGCVGKTFAVTVTVSPVIKVNAVVQNVTCNGANNGSIKASFIPSTSIYNVMWKGPSGFLATTPNIENLAPGDYQLSVSYLDGCPVLKTYTIVEPSQLIVQPNIKKDVSCFGSKDGQIDVYVAGGTPPYNYVWTKNSAPFSTTPALSGLEAGTYDLLVKDANGCIAPKYSALISEPTLLTVKVLSKTDVLCNGSKTGGVEISVQGGVPLETNPGVFDYTYAWTGDNDFKSTAKNLQQIASGTYNLVVTDKNGCSQSLSVELTQPEELVIAVATTPITCKGAANANATLTVTGGKSPYQVQWSNLGSGLVQSNLSPGSYSVTVVDANDCKKTITFVINDANFAIDPKVKNISCFGGHDGSISLNVSGGIAPVTIKWNDSSSSGVTRNNLSAGTYFVTVTDASPCQLTHSFTIVEPQALSLSGTVTDALDCTDKNSGAVNLSVIGGVAPYSYVWPNGLATEDIANVPPGNYSVVVTDANGCVKSANFEVVRAVPISVTVSSLDVYSVDTKSVVKIFTANVSGGVPPYQMKWSSGVVSGVNNQKMETSVPGIVNLEVTDAVGCISNLSINVVIPEIKEPYVRIEYQIIDCEKSTYQFTGLVTGAGAQDAVFNWDFGDGTNSSIKNTTHSYALPGTYHVRLTMTSALGTSICDAKVLVEGLPVIVLNKEAALCQGGSVVIHASGANSYLWSDGSTADSMVVKQKDNFTVIGYSKSGCFKSLSFNSRYFDALNYNLYTDKDEITTDSVTLHLWSDVVPYAQYSWDFGDGLKGQGSDVYHTYNVVSQDYVDVNLTVIGPDGCIGTSYKRIKVNIASPPNVFTPNGDGVNDVFMGTWDNLPINRVGGNGDTGDGGTSNSIKSLNELKMKVYNRNGILLYEGNNGWDGTYKGQYVVNDTYFYVLYYPTSSGVRTKTGFITVVR